MDKGLTKKIVLAKVREEALGFNYGIEPRAVYLSLSDLPAELNLGLQEIAEALKELQAEHEIISFELQTDYKKELDKAMGTVKNANTPLFLILILLEGKNWRVASQLFFNVESGVLRYEDGDEHQLKNGSSSYQFVILLFSNPKKVFSYKEIANALSEKNYDDSKSARLVLQRKCGEILKPIRKKLELPADEFFIANNGYSLIHP